MASTISRQVRANGQRIQVILTDEEFDQITKILRVTPSVLFRKSFDFQLLTALVSGLLPQSVKEQRQQLKAIQTAASRLHDALVNLLASSGSTAALLGLTINRSSPWRGDGLEEGMSLGFGFLDLFGKVLNHAPGNEKEKSDVAEDVCMSFHDLLKSINTLRDAATQTVDEHSTNLRDRSGRRSDFQRDSVVELARRLFLEHRKQRPTLTTHPPLGDETTYSGDFYHLTRIMDVAFLRAAGRDPKTEARIGSVVKRLTTKWSRQGK